MTAIKQFITCTLLICTFLTHAQDICGTNMMESPIWRYNSTPKASDGTGASIEEHRKVLKVHFWDFGGNDTPNDNDTILTEEKMLDIIAGLNREFNAYDIFFKFDGGSVVHSNIWSDMDISERSNFVDYLRDNNHYFPGSLNVYALETLTGVGASALFDSTQGKFSGIMSRTTFYDQYSPVTSHEVGHFLGLNHTFEVITGVENVTRDISDINFNAHTKGDKIVDTNATPVNMQYDPVNCVYTGNDIDPVGIPYSTVEPEVYNFMSYSFACANRFSPGQIGEMRNYIDILEEHPDGLTIITTYPVSILYEPYKGAYYLAGPDIIKPPLFQYGFDYEFVDCSQAAAYNQPSDYDDTSFWYGAVVESYDVDYNNPIPHNNQRAIRILQLNDTQPRKCYNNVNLTPIAGRIVQFLDHSFNANVKIMRQDSIQINNQRIIEDLTPGLYSIQKEFPNGRTEQKVIYKRKQ